MRQINTIQLRRYRPSDCAGILRLFYDTVHTVNRKDYTEEQVEAWAPREQDQEQWNRSFLEHFTVIAVVEGRIAGFGDTWIVSMCTGITSAAGSARQSVTPWSGQRGQKKSAPTPLSPHGLFLRRGATAW